MAMPDERRRLVDQRVAAAQHAEEHVEIAAAIGHGADVVNAPGEGRGGDVIEVQYSGHDLDAGTIVDRPIGGPIPQPERARRNGGRARSE